MYDSEHAGGQRSYSSGGGQIAQPAPRPAPEVARDEIEGATRATTTIERTLQARDAAEHDGDLERWHSLDAQLRFRVRTTELAMQRAHSHKRDATDAERAQLETTTAVFAVQRTAALSSSNAAEPSGSFVIAPPAVALIAAPASVAKASDPAPLSLHVDADEVMQHAFADDSAGRQVMLATALSQMDGTERRMLAKRLATYRPGSGDPVAARFTRLDRSRREEILRAVEGAAPVTLHPARIPTVAEEDQKIMLRDPALLLFAGDAARYFTVHREAFTLAFRARLQAAHLATGAPQLAWVNYDAFIAELATASYAPNASQLPEITHPIDPWKVIDGHRAMTPGDAHVGAMAWSPAAGIAMASAFEQAVMTALPRVGSRYAAAIDRGRDTAVKATDIVPGAPVDRLVSIALCARDVVGRTGDPRLAADVVRPDKLRRIEKLEWMGKTEARLWKWLRVDRPSDASAEEIAIALWGTPDLAHRLTVTNGYASVPTELALELPEARAHAPVEKEARIEVPGVHLADSPVLTLAESHLADVVAFDEARLTAAGPSLEPREVSVDHLRGAKEILLNATGALASRNLSAALKPSLQFVNDKLGWASVAPYDEVARWAHVFAGTYAVVREASEGMFATLAREKEMGPTARAPAAEALRIYSEALGSAHLVDSARTLLATANQRQQEMGIAALEGTTASLAAAVTASADSELASSHLLVSEEIAAMRSELRDGTLDTERAEVTAIDLEQVQFRSHVLQLMQQLRAASSAVEHADDGWFATLANVFAIELEMLPFWMDRAADALSQVDATLKHNTRTAVTEKFAGLPPSPALAQAIHLELTQKRAFVLTSAREQYTLACKQHGISKELFERAAKAVSHAGLRTLFGNIAVMVALSVVSGGAAAIAGEFAGGLVMGGRVVGTVVEAAAVARTARIAAFATELVVDAGISAGGNTLIAGDKLGTGFVENLLSSAAVIAVLKPLQAVARSWGGIDEQLFTMWEKQGATWSIRATKGALMTGELVVAGATSYVVHRVMTDAQGVEPDEQTLASWAAQGATMVLGKFINQRMQASLDRLGNIAENKGQLVARMHRQRALAARVEATGDADAGMELLAAQGDLLKQEAEVWKSLESDPAALHRAGITHDRALQSLAASHQQVESNVALAKKHLPLRLAGLEEEVAGSGLWVGTTEQIAVAVHQTMRSGAEVTVDEAGDAARAWKFTIGGEQLTIRERERHGRVREAIEANTVSPEDVMRADRYATAARALRGKLDERTKRIVEAGTDFSTEVLHLGNAFAGVMHRNTMHEQGTHSDPTQHLVVASHDGTMTGRGDLPSGQNADSQTMPGIRTREHTIDLVSFALSRHLADATEVGRLEMQTSTYRGWVASMESRDNPSSVPWTHADRRRRVFVRTSDGQTRVIYMNTLVEAGGMGPTRYGPVKQLFGSDGDSVEVKNALFEEARRQKRVLGADDHDISEHFGPGDVVLIWGGSASSAWAAEEARMRGARAIIIGESSSRADALAFADSVRSASATLDPVEIEQMIDARIAKTHSGSAIRRNYEPEDASYHPNAKARGDVELGVPTALRLRPDGRMEVVIAGMHAGVREITHFVAGIGQDPGAPGGQGALLGPPAPDGGEVPAGTTALRMVLDANGTLVGLESEDRSVQLVGAAYANPGMAPWVRASQRAEFFARVKAISEAGYVTHTGTEISLDSNGVTTGIEAMRDRIPLRNEVAAAAGFLLPEEVSSRQLSLGADPARWEAPLQRYLESALGAQGKRVDSKKGAQPSRVLVQKLGSKRRGVYLFAIRNGGEDMGLLRVYESEEIAKGEFAASERLKSDFPEFATQSSRGVMQVDGKYIEMSIPASGAPTQSLSEIFFGLAGSADLSGSGEAGLLKIEVSVAAAGAALAKLHAQAAIPQHMAQADKLAVAAQSRMLLAEALANGLFESVDAALVSRGVEAAETTFLATAVPMTAELGSASLMTFGASDGTSVTIKDVGRLAGTRDERGRGTGSSGADVAEFIASLNSPEVWQHRDRLEAIFRDAYERAAPEILHGGIRAERFYSLQLALRDLVIGVPGAKFRVVQLSRNGAQ